MHVSMMYVHLSMMHVSMKHVSMMHVSVMHVSMMHVSMMHVSMMHVSIIHVSMILDPDTCMYDAYIYPDTHVCMILESMMRQILSPTNGRTDRQGDSRSLIAKQ